MEGPSRIIKNNIISKQHYQMCWLALVVNIISTIIIYTYFFENNIIYLSIGMAISLLIILGIILREKKVISSEFFGMIPMITMSVFFAFIYSKLFHLQEIREFTFIYMSIFIGAGMFLLISLKHSITIALITISANIVFYNFNSYLTFSEIMFNGGLVVLSMSLFMIISIFMRYRLVLNDIKSTSELIKSREKIRKSEIQNRLLFNQNPRPMIIYSLDDLKILDVNDTIIEQYGYSKSEFLQMRITDIRPAENVAKVLEDVENVRKGIEKISEWVHLTKKNKKIDVEISATSIDFYGKKARLVLIKNITESKSMQKQLQASLKDLSDYKIAIDETAIVAITDPKGIITYVNDKFCEISKYSKEELIGQDHRILNSGHHPKKFWKELWLNVK